ncbi:integrase catalytic domain-containing protein [Trichonephila clavipes]|nr:integrase catalytic domain-containing protein [Trichonephila clavipes]
MDAETATVLRGRAKAALTRIINFIDKNDQTFDKNDIRNKLEKLELTYTEFDKADAALPIESSEMEEFETKYYETKAKLQNILENLSVRTYVYNDNSDVFENVSNMKSSNFKLPKINIERFSGDYKNWPSFKDLYVSLVHDNMCLSNIQKFQYLRGLLLSEPANIIKHIPITETAYNEAWEKLLARYDKKKQIIFSLIKTFMEQPSFNDTNSHNLRNIADTSDEVIRGLKSIDTKAESRDVWCIKQIALDDKDNPNLSRVLQEDIYMDDLLSGADTPNNAISICKDIAHVLSTRGFHLRKWNSNSTEFLAQFSEHSSHDARVEFSKDSNESSKVLGLFWNSSNDTFGFQLSLELTPPLTKRHWDSPIPQQLTEDWLRFQKAFNAINYLTVPRWVILTADNIVELHGFADASSLAYAAAIYCRQKHNGKIKVQLLVSKTKVAPVKQVSIPRLELCGAHLLSKLFKSVLRTLKYYTFDVFAWTDSRIVLSWLSGHPRKWKTFVANRTSEIMEVLPTKHWRHVPSKENPADIASRGIDPKCLPDCKLWWQGPPWLRLETSSWPKAESSCDEASDEHSISELLIKEQHIAHLHAGPTLLAHVLRQSHWIVGSRKLINKCIRKCLKCNKFKTSTTTPQLMGNLPKHRVTLERPFFSCGIDYAGPVLIKCNKGRGTKSTKGYIALFVCLATKAVHIEAVGDLTTDSFIAALRRFSARRGAPRHIYSDNGTNFVGARRKLDEIRKLWLSLPTNEAISYYLSKSSIDWHFIPPSSPHFEVFGNQEFDPSRGASFNLQPQRSLGVLQNIKRGFWKKWSSEFISSLQPRKKWQDAQPNLKEDDIVLIKEEGPPGTWPMARVLQVHPGNDGLVRVATVKTQDSVFKRPVHKLHKLPIYPN